MFYQVTFRYSLDFEPDSERESLILIGEDVLADKGVISEGIPYNHIQENTEALNAVGKAIEMVKGKLDKDRTNKQLQEILSDLSKLKDKVNQTMK